MRASVLFLLLLLPFCACYSQEADKSGFIPYHDEATGWTTKYSIWFKRMTEDEVNELQGKGKKLLEETLGTEMETLHRDLLYIKMDQGNSMTSTTQGFDSTADGSYEDIRKAELSAIEEVYVKKGIKYQVIYGIREIDGLEFSTMEVLIYAGESRKVIFGQIFYDRLIDGKMILMLNINYTNEVAKRMLLQTIDSSKFSIRD